ncbi:MAG: efflux RND transporter periplasmic adaptor subunit [Betaproteobacteria bacterium]|nr:efflux RND transporter periplasmic adaptor subunit [Betaproteobacteria bacterium]
MPDQLKWRPYLGQQVAFMGSNFHRIVNRGRNSTALVWGVLSGLGLVFGVISAHAGENNANNQAVSLTAAQMKFVVVEPVSVRNFSVNREAVGNTDYDQDTTAQVSSPYPGRILAVMAKAGDNVRKGQALFTIASPDLLQAESALLTTAGVMKLTTAALQRAQALYAAQGMAQKDYQQAVSDQQSAEAAYKSAVDAVRIFGKSEAQINQIVSRRQIDATMPVLSPLTGRVTARNAAVGTLVQPGGTPPPFVVSDLSSKWLLANVDESDLPLMRLGETVEAHLMAYPDQVFRGKIDNIAAAIDPNTHRITVRANLRDPQNLITPQMMATFTVLTGTVLHSPAVPDDGVVREGDGTMTVWVTTDKRHFYRRTVILGMRQHGVNQILSGLKGGELVATEGALFISNAYALDMK